jgi:hypothetical protein
MNCKVAQSTFDQLTGHLHHKVKLVAYGMSGRPPWDSLTVECQTCGQVIADWEPTSRKNKRSP